jgi:hypothetical protein
MNDWLLAPQKKFWLSLGILQNEFGCPIFSSLQTKTGEWNCSLAILYFVINTNNFPQLYP